MSTHKRIKLVIERTEEGYVGYALGLNGVVVAEGDTYEETEGDLKSAVRFHIETFGEEALPDESGAPYA